MHIIDHFGWHSDCFGILPCPLVVTLAKEQQSNPSLSLSRGAAQFFFVWTMPDPTTLKLKQRLAALSQSSLSNAHESPRSSTGAWSPATAKRKFFNNPPWMKSPTSPTNHAPEFTDPEVVQEVLSRMIFQAGVDFEWEACAFYLWDYAECFRTRPM